MIGWASNWQYANDTPTHPWRSAMSLVREVSLIRCTDGRIRLAQQPVLPDDRSSLSVFELSVPCGPDDRTALVLSGDETGEDEVVITIDGTDRSITCDRTRSGAVDFHSDFASVDFAPLPVHQETSLNIVIVIVVDAMIVEIYAAGGLVTLTEQVFPTSPLTILRRETLSPSRFDKLGNS